MPPWVGVDSYAYHRLLGEIRPGETPPPHRFGRGSLDVVAEARLLELEFALLQTSLAGSPDAFEDEEYLDEAGPLSLGLSWGAPDGFSFGDRADALDELIAWLAHAEMLTLPLTRIVVGGPAHRGRLPSAAAAELLREACAAARDHGVRLALENHGDLTAEQLQRLLEEVGDDDLCVCFDTANALRVGDDVAAAAQRLASAIATHALCSPVIPSQEAP